MVCVGVAVRRTEVKKLTDALSRLFNDSHIKLLGTLIDTLTLVITSQQSSSPLLSDWLAAMLPRLLTKSASESAGSLHSKMMHTFDIIRSV